MAEVETRKESIQRALEAVAAGTSLRSAAKMFNVRVTTLYDHHKNSVDRRDGAGKPTVLSADEEQEIVTWLEEMASAGHPICEEMLKINVAQYAKDIGKAEAFKDGIPSRGWVRRFLKRHPNISKRTANPISKRRIVTPDEVRSWFQEVEQYLVTNGYAEILNDPSRVFNMDESSFEMAPNPRKKKVLVKRGMKNVQSIQGNSNRESYTVLMTGSAGGMLGPPLILFPYKERLPRNVAQSIPKGWGVGRTESGWMNGGSFYECMVNVFHPWLVKENIKLPVILFVDGHRSHATYETVKFCKSHGIILVCLPPNSTHFIQPLDVSFFKPMKATWDTELVKWRFENGGAIILKPDFAPLLKKALNSMKNIDQTLTNGFRKCGLYPWNAEAIDYASFPDPSSVPQTKHPNISKISSISAEPVNQSIPSSIFLRELNRRILPDVLKSFEEQRRNLMWTGDLEASHLFNLWRNVQDEVDGPPEYLEMDPALVGLDVTLDADGSAFLSDDISLDVGGQNNDSYTYELNEQSTHEEFLVEKDINDLDQIDFDNNSPGCSYDTMEKISQFRGSSSSSSIVPEILAIDSQNETNKNIEQQTHSEFRIDLDQSVFEQFDIDRNISRHGFDVLDNISQLPSCSDLPIAVAETPDIAEQSEPFDQNRNSEANKPSSRKRRAPAVATSDAWEEFYREEQEIKNQIQIAKQQRLADRKQKAEQREQDKQMKAALRVLKQQEREELKEKKEKERDELRLEKQKQRLEKSKKKLKQLKNADISVEDV